MSEPTRNRERCPHSSPVLRLPCHLPAGHDGPHVHTADRRGAWTWSPRPRVLR